MQRSLQADYHRAFKDADIRGKYPSEIDDEVGEGGVELGESMRGTDAAHGGKSGAERTGIVHSRQCRKATG